MSRKPTSSQKRAKLRALAAEVRHSTYEMLQIVADLLSDHSYVDQFGGEPQLIEDIEAKEFAHFGGRPTLAEMLSAYRANPDQATWTEYHHNIWAMIELAAPAKGTTQREYVNWKALAKDLEARVEEMKAIIKRLEQRESELSSQVSKLLSENGELRGQVRALESFAKGAAA